MVGLTNLNVFSLSKACTDKLVQNDPAFVELSLERLGDNFDLDEFVHALQVNHTVRHVCFSGVFVRQLQADQWGRLLEAVGRLETLEELQIWCSTIPVSVLRKTIDEATRLRKVYFFRVTLDGDQDSFDRLAAVIGSHSSLQDIRFGGFQLKDDTVSLDSVMTALSKAPRLEAVSLQLSGINATVPFSCQAFETLFGSSSIADLYISRLGLSGIHFSCIAKALVNNKTLRVLDAFGNGVQNAQIALIAHALESNTTLETLVLPCPANELNVKSCAAISQALQKNKTLLTLTLPRTNLGDDGLLHIAHGLTVNTTLKKVEVGLSKDLGDIGNKALERMLEKNYELERLVVSSTESDIKAKVGHYMRLNEVGRGALLRDGKATREAWVEMLVSVCDDLDCLFYFLSMNPSLCLFANAAGAEVIVTEEFRISRRHTIGFPRPPGEVRKHVSSRRASTAL